MSIFLSAVNVYLRDTQHLTEVLLMAWFWATPIVYSYGQICLADQPTHPSLTWLSTSTWAIPITPIAMTFQRAIYGKTQYILPSRATRHAVPTSCRPGEWAPTPRCSASSSWSSVGLFLLALIVFGRLEGNFAEEL